MTNKKVVNGGYYESEEEPSLTPSLPLKLHLSPGTKEKGTNALGGKPLHANRRERGSLVASEQKLIFEKLGALLKLEEAAEMLRVSVWTLRDWRYHHILPDEVFVSINGRVRLRRDLLERWILSQNP